MRGISCGACFTFEQIQYQLNLFIKIIVGDRSSVVVIVFLEIGVFLGGGRGKPISNYLRNRKARVS